MIERLEIARAKIEDYLLDPQHLEGWSKAKFFMGRGFRRDSPDVLADALARQASFGWPGEEVVGPFAIKHRILGPITCPDGSTAEILTVWQIAIGGSIAAFVTARPHRRKT